MIVKRNRNCDQGNPKKKLTLGQGTKWANTITINLIFSSSTATELCALHEQLYSFEIDHVH